MLQALDDVVLNGACSPGLALRLGSYVDAGPIEGQQSLRVVWLQVVRRESRELAALQRRPVGEPNDRRVVSEELRDRFVLSAQADVENDTSDVHERKVKAVVGLR